MCSPVGLNKYRWLWQIDLFKCKFIPCIIGNKSSGFQCILYFNDMSVDIYHIVSRSCILRIVQCIPNSKLHVCHFELNHKHFTTDFWIWDFDSLWLIYGHYSCICNRTFTLEYQLWYSISLGNEYVIPGNLRHAEQVIVNFFFVLKWVAFGFRFHLFWRMTHICN